MDYNNYVLHLEPPQGLKPRELYKLGYMWAPEEVLESFIVSGQEDYIEMD